MTIRLRAATPADAADMAELVNMAGEGLPATMWASQATRRADAMDIGRAYSAEPEGPFSWTHATIAEIDGEVAGMVTTYLTSEHPFGFDEDTHPLVRPLLMLESQAPATRYVNAIATFERFRRRGVGRALMGHAEARPGRNGMAVITTDCNRGAQSFVHALGFAPAGSLPVIKADWDTPSRNWILLRKPR